MRQRAVERKNEEMEVMEVEEEGKSGEESESESEYEEYTDSEDEAEPRLKPVFIRKYELTTALRHNCSAAVFRPFRQQRWRLWPWQNYLLYLHIYHDLF